MRKRIIMTIVTAILLVAIMPVLKDSKVFAGFDSSKKNYINPFEEYNPNPLLNNIPYRSGTGEFLKAVASSGSSLVVESPNPDASSDPAASLTPSPAPTLKPTAKPTVKPSVKPSIAPVTKKPVKTPTPSKPPKVNKISIKIQQKSVKKPSKLTIHWKKVKGAKKYRVYIKKKKSKYKKSKLIKKKKIIKTIKTDTKYKIVVRAYNKKMELVGTTGVVKFGLPKSPYHFHAKTEKHGYVLLRWRKSKLASNYVIYRKKGKASYKKIANTKKKLYIDKKTKHNVKYTYKIVSYADKDYNYSHSKTNFTSYIFNDIVATNHAKYTYEEMKSDISALKKRYGGKISYQVIGTTADNRNIYDIIIGNRNTGKSMLVVSSIHAREYMCTLLSMKQIEYYLQNYYNKIGKNTIASKLSTMCIHFIAMANPDGISISQSGLNAIKKPKLRKKLTKIAAGTDTRYWKANARGVDLNLNYPVRFKVQGTGPSPSGYSGKKASSEKETKAILALIKSLKSAGKLTGVINYHSTGSIIFGYNDIGSPVKDITRKMYDVAIKTTGYSSSASYSSGSGGCGNLREYLIEEAATPSITLEIGVNPCPLAIKEFKSIWKKNKTLIIKEANLF